MIPSLIVPIRLNEVIGAIKACSINDGTKISIFEQNLSKYIGCENVLLTYSGRTALYVLLQAYQLEKGDEIIIPAYNCETVARLIIDMGYKLKFVDVNENTYNINIEDLSQKITRKTKAIIALHMFGNPCEMNEIMEIAKDYGSVVIEDAAQSIGAEYDQKKIGSIGDAGFFSLGEGKPFTTINGGFIVTNDNEIANKCKKIIEDFNVLGWNNKFATITKLLIYYMIQNPQFYDLIFKLIESRRPRRRDKLKMCTNLGTFKFKYSDMHASMGMIQFLNLQNFNHYRINNATFLIERLKEINGLHFPIINRNSKPIFLRLPIWIENITREQRDDLINQLKISGIDTPVAYPNSIPKFFFDLNGFPNAEKLVNKTIMLPTHPYVKQKNLERMITMIENFMHKSI